jgi:ankyrin repeat protein
VTKIGPGKPPGPRLSKKQANNVIKAINANDIAAVESALDKGMDINSMLYGGTLLMKAANLGTDDMVKMLISRGANLNYRTSRGDDALSVAMSNSHHWKLVVPTLVESGIIIDEKTPIWKIAFKTKRGKLLPEAKKMLELLFARGANPNCYTSKKESTIIMYYAKKGWLDPLTFFLDHGADVNAKTQDGKTALSMALTKPRRPEKPAQKKERQAVVDLLRSKGAK